MRIVNVIHIESHLFSSPRSLFCQYAARINISVTNSIREFITAPSLIPDIIMLTIDDLILQDIRKDLTKISTQWPRTGLIGMVSRDPGPQIIDMIGFGFKSFLPTNVSEDELCKAINIVNNGSVYIPEPSARLVTKYLNQMTKTSGIPEISEQEKKLITMITDGLSSRQIGERLCKSHRTVDDMREKLYQKLQVHNKVELIKLVVKHGI